MPRLQVQRLASPHHTCTGVPHLPTWELRPASACVYYFLKLRLNVKSLAPTLGSGDCCATRSLLLSQVDTTPEIDTVHPPSAPLAYFDLKPPLTMKFPESEDVRGRRRRRQGRSYPQHPGTNGTRLILSDPSPQQPLGVAITFPTLQMRKPRLKRLRFCLS